MLPHIGATLGTERDSWIYIVELCLHMILRAFGNDQVHPFRDPNIPKFQFSTFFISILMACCGHNQGSEVKKGQVAFIINLT